MPINLVAECFWKVQAKRVILPYAKLSCEASCILSSAIHVEFGVNLGGPSPKAKYDLVTDSVPVP